MKYILSDIHGNKAKWDSILDQIQLTENDELYILGDVIDRHPYGIEILQQIIHMPNAHMILGNHEYMMLESLGCPYEANREMWKGEVEGLKNQWFHNGGEVTLNAYNKLSAEEQMEIINYLRSLPLNINVQVGKKVYRLCHATIEEFYDLVEHPDPFETKEFFCVWDRDTIAYIPEMENFTVVFGHTPTFQFQPEKNPLEIFRNGNLIGIDCGCGWPEPDEDFPYQGRLACIRLDDEEVFYSKN